MSLRVAILSSGGGYHTDALAGALLRRGHRVERARIQAFRAELGSDLEVSSGGHPLSRCDAVLVRTIPRGSLEQMVFRVDTLHALERQGVAVVNPASAIEKTVDKFYTQALLARAGLPTPRTVVAEDLRGAFEAFAAMRDVIVKPLFGSNGRGMVRVSDEEIAHRVFRALELERAVYYVQEAIDHEGRDIRAFVVGDRVVAAAYRRAPGWRTNLARGGQPEPLTLNPEWEEMSLRAARAVDAAYAGVDLLPSRDGRTFVLEVNGIPGWQGLQQTTECDLAQAIVEHLETRVGGRS
jgi:RimK family alpha-L-glutamate ligase